MQTSLATMKYMHYAGSTAPKSPSRLDIIGRRGCLRQISRSSKRDLICYRYHYRSAIIRAKISLDAGHANLNLKEPSLGLASIDQALVEVAYGRFVLVLNGEDRENEGDVIGAADRMTQESLHFMIRHTSGLVCVALDDEAADRLNLPLMISSIEKGDAMKTAFTVYCDHVESTTGISAGECAATICRLGTTDVHTDEFVNPGHMCPLRARMGGGCLYVMDMQRQRMIYPCSQDVALPVCCVRLSVTQKGAWRAQGFLREARPEDDTHL